MRFLGRVEQYRDAQGSIDWLAYYTACGVQGFLHPAEIARLVDLATDKDYLEIGAFKGLSAWCVAHTAASVTSVDTFKANDAGQDQQDHYTTLAEYDRVTAEFGQLVTRLPFSSERAAELLPADKQFDVIFLDAMHDYDSCMRDLVLWWPRVKMGGVMALHDYGHDHWPGVQKAADEFFGPPAEPWIVTLRVVHKDVYNLSPLAGPMRDQIVVNVAAQTLGGGTE